MSSPRRPAAAAALLLAALAAAVVGLGTTPTVSAQDVSLGWDGPYKEDCAFWPEKLVYGFYTGESTVGQANPDMYFDWLSDKLNVDVEVKEFDSYGSLAEAFVADEVDVINLRSASNTVKIEEEAEARGEPHAVDYSIRFEDSKNQTHYYSFVISRLDNPAQTVCDLAGKKFCLGDPDSTSGSVIPTSQLNLHESCIGGDLFDFADVIYSGGHETTVAMVLNGTCEAGAVWDGMLVRMRANPEDYTAKIPGFTAADMDALHSIWVSPEIPLASLVFRDSLPQAFKQAFKGVHFTLQRDDPEVWLAGIGDDVRNAVAGEFEDYNVVREARRYLAEQATGKK